MITKKTYGWGAGYRFRGSPFNQMLLSKSVFVSRTLCGYFQILTMAPKKKETEKKKSFRFSLVQRTAMALFSGYLYIFASFNDTFVHVTDLTGRQTFAPVTGGMMVKASRDKSSPYAAMQAAQEVKERLNVVGITPQMFEFGVMVALEQRPQVHELKTL